MKSLHLVLGASGHLGNNLVRELLNAGQPVRASIRNPNKLESLKELDCEVVQADLMDKNSLKAAMKGVTVLYLVAAVYKSWATDVQKEIVDVNVKGTMNAIESAAAAGVKKVLYVSTSLAANHNHDPIDVEGWNTDLSDPYRASKTEAEKLAWRLAKKYGLWMVSVLPSALIGPHCYGHITPSMGVIRKILDNQLPIDPDFYFNYIDVRDAAHYARIAAENGKPGERYLLCQNTSIGSTEVFRLARSLFTGIEIPPKKPYLLMLLAAHIMNFKGKLTKQQPMMMPGQIKSFYRADNKYDTAKAAKDLGFNPKPQTEVLKDFMLSTK